MIQLFLKSITALSIRYSKAVILLSSILAVLSLAFAYTTLQFDTNQDNLISKDQEYFVRYKEFLDEFGDWEHIYLVIDLDAMSKSDESEIDFKQKQRQMARSAMDAVVAKLKQHPEQFESIEYKIPKELVMDQLLLLAPDAEYRSTLSALTENSQTLQNFLSIKSSAEFYRFSRTLFSQLSKEDNNPAMEKLWPLFKNLIQAPFDGTKLSLVESIDFLELATDFRIDAQGYFFSENGKLLFARIMPTKNYSSMEIVAQPLQTLRTALNDVRSQYPELIMGITGRPVLQNDEATSTQSDNEWAGLISFILVALLTFAYFKSFKRSLFIVLALVIGMSWTVGLITLVYGSINLITIVFTIILIGLGIDYGIHYLIGYQASLKSTASIDQAIQHTTTDTGRGILMGATTSSIAFLTAIFTDFLGLQQLGIIAGIGILFCCLSELLVFPALLHTFDRKSQHKSLTFPSFEFLHVPDRHQGKVLVLIAVITLASMVCLYHLRFNHNLLDLQDPTLESVRFEKVIQNKSDHSTWFLAQSFTNLDELRDVNAKLLKLTTVKSTSSIFDLVSQSPGTRLNELIPLQNQFKAALEATRSTHSSVNLKLEISEFHKHVSSLATKAFSTGLEEEFFEMNQLKKILSNLITDVNDQKLTTPRHEARFMAVIQSLQQLMIKLLHPTPKSESDLPPNLLAMYKSPTGKYALSIFPKNNIWNDEKMKDFLAEVRTILPDVTGAPVTHFESAERMMQGFAIVAILTSLIVFLMMVLGFRNFKSGLIVFANLAVGLSWLAGYMWLFDISINLANFFAIPVLIGSGIDQGIHVLHKYEHSKSIREVYKYTIPAIALSCLTTLFGFVSLSFVSHRGLASFGQIMSAGTLFTFLLASLALPTWLKSRSK